MTGSGSAAARPPAPGVLALVQAFVNSRDIEAGTDAISTPDGLRQWLSAHDLPSAPRPSPADVLRVTGLREAIRESLHANAHHEAVAGGRARDPLEGAAAGVRLRVAGSPAGPVLEPAGSGIDAALGTILAAAVATTADGTWVRLKVCRNDACRWAYWDTSRNRSGIWCTMAVCGNRAKGATFRLRAREQADDPRSRIT